ASILLANVIPSNVVGILAGRVGALLPACTRFHAAPKLIPCISATYRAASLLPGKVMPSIVVGVFGSGWASVRPCLTRYMAVLKGTPCVWATYSAAAFCLG